MVAAALFSAVIVVGAYVLARGVESPDVAQASTETALLQAIATKDSDGDGLPDWEETLYGADPHNPDTFALGMTDGEAVAAGLIVPKAMSDIPSATSSQTVAGADGLPPAPAEGTLTAAFAKSFFTSYLAAKQDAGGGALSESDMKNVSNQAFGSLSSAVAIAPNFKSSKDIKVSGSGADAMKTFAASAEAVLLKNTADATKTPLGYLKSILEDNDTTALPHLSSIASMYRSSAAGLAVLPVPRELAADNLALANALMRMSQITLDFTKADTDPLTTILALQQYPSVAQELATAFLNIGKAYADAGITLRAGEPGASLVNLAADVTAIEQATTPKP
jgi:hypothetical protein